MSIMLMIQGLLPANCRKVISGLSCWNHKLEAYATRKSSIVNRQLLCYLAVSFRKTVPGQFPAIHPSHFMVVS